MIAHGILNSVGDGVYGVNPNGVVQFINPAALVMLGFPHASAVVGKSASEILHYAFEDGTRIPPSACFLSQCYRESNQIAGWQTTFWSESKKPVLVECTVYPLDIDGKREGSVVAFRDVSQRRILEDELRYQATHDSLTKLHNRAHFEQQLNQEVVRLKRSEQESLLLFIDCDRFKYINDTAGHAAGDQLLVEFSHRLKQRLRVSDTLARMGGDEYALILRNISGSDPARLAEEFLRALASKPFVYGDKSYWITVSIGVARINQHCASALEAMQNADIACHAAKNAGRNQVSVYSHERDERASMDVELNWSARVEQALKQNLFKLVFQPVIPIALCEELDAPGAVWESARQRTPGRMFFECLLRMRGHDNELISPNAFLPTAERYNMMTQVDRWVVHHAFKVLKEHNGPPIGLSINLSAQSMSDPQCTSYINDKLVEFDVDPRAITFEITETRALNNLAAAKSLISELKALGFRFALDDFGSGFSSFTHLKDLDVDFLKIDGVFTQGVLDGAIERAVVQSIVNIAHAVGKKTIAEYVDRPELVEALRSVGVDFLQGYYIGEPQLQAHSEAAAYAPTVLDAPSEFSFPSFDLRLDQNAAPVPVELANPLAPATPATEAPADPFGFEALTRLAG
jgi:diguanylate cyclase (GGDEF)-like protein